MPASNSCSRAIGWLRFYFAGLAWQLEEQRVNSPFNSASVIAPRLFKHLIGLLEGNLLGIELLERGVEMAVHPLLILLT